MNKNAYPSKEEKEKAKELATVLSRLSVEDLQRLFWIMQGMKLARY